MNNEHHLERFFGYFDALASAQELSADDAEHLARLIFDGTLEPEQVAAALTALRTKGETAVEISAFSRVMREKCNRVHLPAGGATDLVGTGGDRSNSINISTTSALVCAAAGIRIAKHGNKSVSSLSGSADILQALGVHIMVPPERTAECLERAGFAFMFAPLFHPMMKNVGPIRQKLKIRTVFNLIGPLTNPAGADTMLLGIYSRERLPLFADALSSLKIRRAYIVSSFDGLDEVSLSDNTDIIHFSDGTWQRSVFDPETYGFKKTDKQVFEGSGPEVNAGIIRRIIAGKDRSALTDIIILNAGFALAVANDIELSEGFTLAEKTLRSGAVEQKLAQLISVSRELAA